MKMLILLMTIFTFTMTETTKKIDFGKGKSGDNWQVINDDVMGGRSSSQFELQENSLIFKGNVSLENNGGFASLRSPFGKVDLSDYKTVTIRYKGTQRAFAFTLENERAYYRPSFKKILLPKSTDWETITLTLSDFEAYSLGRNMGYNLTPKIQEDIIRMGIILNDKKSGGFELEVDFIEFK